MNVNQPDDLTPGSADHVAGGVYLDLVSQPDGWVDRRIEKMRFVGQGRVTRRVSVHFRIPENLDRLENETTTVPLTLLQKETLSGFSVWNEDGRTLPVFTHRANAVISWWMLVVAAEIAAGRQVSAQLCRDLWDVAASDAVSASARLEHLLGNDLPPGDVSADLREMRRNRGRFDSFVRVANDLAKNFVLLVEVESGPHRQRVIKFAYDEPPVLEGLTGPSWTGLDSTVYFFDVPAVADCSSCHLEVEPPTGLVLDKDACTLSVTSATGAAPVSDAAGHERLVHLYLTGVEPGAGRDGTANIHLAPDRRHGVFRVARWSAGFAFAVLLLGGLFPKTLERAQSNADAAVALLLLVPGVLIAYATKPGEHLLASHLLRGVRVIGLAIGASLYIAAAALVLSVALQFVWLVLAAFVAVCGYILLSTVNPDGRPARYARRMVDKLPMPTHL